MIDEETEVIAKMFSPFNTLIKLLILKLLSQSVYRKDVGKCR